MDEQIYFLFVWFTIMFGVFAIAGFIAEYFFNDGDKLKW